MVTVAHSYHRVCNAALLSCWDCAQHKQKYTSTPYLHRDVTASFVASIDQEGKEGQVHVLCVHTEGDFRPDDHDPQERQAHSSNTVDPCTHPHLPIPLCKLYVCLCCVCEVCACVCVCVCVRACVRV